MRTPPSNQRGEVQVLWLVAAVLVAGLLVAAPFVLAGRNTTEQAETGMGAVSQARDVQAQANLQSAIRAAMAYYAENGTYVGLGPGSGAYFDPGVTYNTSPTAVAGQVSIRGVTPATVVLATKTMSGAALCAAANLTTVSYGRADAASAAACTGGW
jgi:hypothetical protein